MASRSTTSSTRELPEARILKSCTGSTLLNCGVDPRSLPILEPKTQHMVMLVRGVRPYAANILKQSMLSLGGDAAVHRDVITGKAQTSDCIIIGDLRHFRKLTVKLKSQPGMEPIAEAVSAQLGKRRERLKLVSGSRIMEWTELPVIMGILNITPDSFSDGGKWFDPGKALDHANMMIEEGAQIIDIGGESTRPGAAAVDNESEIERVVPVIKKIAENTNIPISVDTRNAEVAQRAMDAGAAIINDISALEHDPMMIPVAKDTGAAVVLMHMRGTPETMQSNTRYKNVVQETYDYLRKRIDVCLDAGIAEDSIVVDPGIGFGKDLNGNLELIRHIAEFRSLGVPVLLGHSKKSFLGAILDLPVEQRQEGTDAVSAWATMEGVDILRVHDVKRTGRTKSVIRAIKESQ